jgi:hypothetical protein
MMFPENWAGYSRKRARPFMEGVDEKHTPESEPVGFVSDLQHSIERALNQTYPELAAGKKLVGPRARVLQTRFKLVFN